MNYKIFIILFLILYSIFSLDARELATPKFEGRDILTLYSEDAILKVRMRASSRKTYENSDMIYPNGVYLEFFNEKKQIIATLVANYVEYFNDENIYILKDEVKLVNLEKNETLETRELIWEPNKKRIHNDCFVKITTPKIKIMGTGLDAKQDLSYWSMSETKGTIKIQEKTKAPKQE